MNSVNGNVKPYTKYTFTNSEKLNAPINIAFTETNFILLFFCVYYYYFNFSNSTSTNITQKFTSIQQKPSFFLRFSNNCNFTKFIE